MKKQSIIVSAFLVVVFIIGFTYQIQAAEKSIQKNIVVLFDNGVTEKLDARQAKAQTQLSDWMDDDLVRVLGRYAKVGYQAKMIEKRQDFIRQPDSYLLNVKVIEYHPGSKAARMWVGYGAGGVSLKIHYELFGNGVNAILTKDDSVFSGREWMNAARKLNENMAKVVTDKLGDK